MPATTRSNAAPVVDAARDWEFVSSRDDYAPRVREMEECSASGITAFADDNIGH